MLRSKVQMRRLHFINHFSVFSNTTSLSSCVLTLGPVLALFYEFAVFAWRVISFPAMPTWTVVGPAEITRTVLVARVVTIAIGNDYIERPVL